MADVAARERERHSKEIEDQKEKEKLVEGGELPGHIREPVTCDLPDEVPAGEDLYVHCRNMNEGVWVYRPLKPAAKSR